MYPEKHFNYLCSLFHVGTRTMTSMGRPRKSWGCMRGKHLWDCYFFIHSVTWGFGGGPQCMWIAREVLSGDPGDAWDPANVFNSKGQKARYPILCRSPMIPPWVWKIMSWVKDAWIFGTGQCSLRRSGTEKGKSLRLSSTVGRVCE
jgi:hypothetical protein